MLTAPLDPTRGQSSQTRTAGATPIEPLLANRRGGEGEGEADIGAALASLITPLKSIFQYYCSAAIVGEDNPFQMAFFQLEAFMCDLKLPDGLSKTASPTVVSLFDDVNGPIKPQACELLHDDMSLMWGKFRDHVDNQQADHSSESRAGRGAGVCDAWSAIPTVARRAHSSRTRMTARRATSPERRCHGKGPDDASHWKVVADAEKSTCLMVFELMYSSCIRKDEVFHPRRNCRLHCMEE